MKLFTTDNEGSSLIKHGSWIESSSLRWLSLANKIASDGLDLLSYEKMFLKLKASFCPWQAFPAQSSL